MNCILLRAFLACYIDHLQTSTYLLSIHSSCHRKKILPRMFWELSIVQFHCFAVAGRCYDSTLNFCAVCGISKYLLAKNNILWAALKSITDSVAVSTPTRSLQIADSTNYLSPFFFPDKCWILRPRNAWPSCSG